MNLLRQKSLALVAPLVGVTAVSGFLLASRPVSAETASASVTVRSACTFSAVVDIAHTATINPGTYQDDIGKTTFSVTCNDAGGYSIYAIGYGNQEYGNTKLLANIGGTLTPSYDINTGTNTSGASAWAMKLTPRTNLTASNIVNGYGSYSVVPTTYTKVATMVPTTTIPNPTSLETTYRVNIASSQPAGTYNGKVRYTMVNPATNIPNQPRDCTANRICYWPNAGDMSVGGVGVVDSMGDQSITSSETSATLWASNFQRPGYGFVGWSDAFDYVANEGSESNPDAHIYGPNEDITFTARQYSSTNGGLSLYAVWVPSEGNFQTWNGCNALGSGEVTALTDLRDNDTYAVAKLADGNCWMIENLRLDYDANITTANTQSNNGAFGGVFTGLADPEVANFSDSTTPNSLYTTDTASTTLNIITGSFTGRRFPRYRNDNTNTDTTKNPNTTATNMTSTGQNIYSYGNYYTWAAAIADTGNYTTNNQSISTTSLCPTGWHLPTGGQAYASGSTSGVNVTGNASTFREFYNLGYKIMDEVKTAYEDTPNSGYSYYSGNTTNLDGDTATKAFRKYPNNFLYSGYARDSSVSSRSSNGYYWSSTATDYSYSYYLYLGSSNVRPGTDYYDKYRGYSVRCVADEAGGISL